MVQHAILHLFFSAILLSGCRYGNLRDPEPVNSDSASIIRLIDEGDSIYSQKRSYHDFMQSMEHYERAYNLARQTNDTFLLAESVLAKGRAYDALNNNPQKTIDFYSEAADYYRHLPDKQRGLYIRHLVAHAYDKVNDSVRCVQVLQDLFQEILPMPDSLRNKMMFISEMALISTVVKNYELADSILNFLTHRSRIINDSSTYDYLNHFYLTRARIDVYHNGSSNSAYLDSVRILLEQSKNSSDSMYYSRQLGDLYKFAGQKELAARYLTTNIEIFDRFNSPDQLRKALDQISRMEIAAVEEERKVQQQQSETRQKNIYILSGLLLVISVLALFLYNRINEIRLQKKKLLITNEKLQQKNIQNELLNKERDHRVKNNLQMIMSLVDMQERRTDNKFVKENLFRIRTRIESIAALHQQMTIQDGDGVNLKIYFSQLVNKLVELIANDAEVITDIDIDDHEIPSQQSFPLGLLINEWVTNSLKHATVLKHKLTINISIHIAGDQLTIEYFNSGRQITGSDVNPGLGSDIIRLLVAQLGGTLTRKETNYFYYHLVIPSHG